MPRLWIFTNISCEFSKIFWLHLFDSSGGSKISQGAQTACYFAKLLLKTAWKWKNLDWEGRIASLAPLLDPPLDNIQKRKKGQFLQYLVLDILQIRLFDVFSCFVLFFEILTKSYVGSPTPPPQAENPGCSPVIINLPYILKSTTKWRYHLLKKSEKV